MPLLIDGHNLIARMPDIDLADADDEAELVRRLRQYCRRQRRRATVVFDAGLPGGRDPGLSGACVEVVFASIHSDADAVLRQRIHQAPDPRGLLVVSSDRAVQDAARRRGARIVPAEDMVKELSADDPSDAEDEKPVPNEGTDEWLRLFEEGT